MAYLARHKREKRNIIIAAFRDISIGADCYFSLKHSNLLRRFCSGENGTHCYFLPLSTSLSCLQQCFDSFPSVLDWHITLGAKDCLPYIFTFLLLFWNESPGFIFFYWSSVQWQQQRTAQLIGRIYELRELTPFLWVVRCVCACVDVCVFMYISIQTHFVSCKWARTKSFAT